MNELGLLREVGAGGGPSDDEIEAARAHARERLHAAIAAEQRSASRLERFRDAIAARRVLLAGAAAALAAVLAVGVALTALRPPAAAARLDRLAVVAERAQHPQPTGSDFVYTQSRVTELMFEETVDGGELAFLAVRDVERWVNADGQLRVRSVYAEPVFFAAGDAAAFRAAGLDGLYGAGVTSEETFASVGAGGPAGAEWSTDPDTLRDQMLDDLGNRGDGAATRAAQMLELAASILQAPDAAPELRGAVLRVLAGEDGVEVTSTEAPGGRPMVKASSEFDSDGVRLVRSLVFDAETAHLAESMLVAIDPLPGGIPAGTVLRGRVNMPAVAVPAIDAVPPAGSGAPDG